MYDLDNWNYWSHKKLSSNRNIETIINQFVTVNSAISFSGKFKSIIEVNIFLFFSEEKRCQAV